MTATSYPISRGRIGFTGLRVGALAGLAGGAAEVAWIGLYASLSGTDAAAVARGVADTVWPALAQSESAVAAGIAIHMAIAVALGIAVAIFVRSLLPRSWRSVVEPLAVVGILAAVWAVNFMVVLPAINPAFADLIPYAASLTSKVLFGFAAAAVLRIWGAARPA